METQSNISLQAGTVGTSTMTAAWTPRRLANRSMATALAYRFLIATRPFVRKFSASHHQARLAGVEVGRHLVFFQSSPWFRSGSAIVGIPTRTETIKTDIFATSGMTMFSGRSFSSSTLNSKGEPVSDMPSEAKEGEIGRLRVRRRQIAMMPTRGIADTK